MVPAIGYMIGFYIITRMFSFLLREGERKEPTFVKFLAGFTILVVLVCMGILFSGELSTYKNLGY